MPRELVLGNGTLLINFDKNYCLRDLFYPYVGLENHVGGYEHRLGVWVDGKFSWTDEWKKKLSYKRETLVSDCSLMNNEFGIEIKASDAVHYNKNIFMRKITVRNLKDEKREIRVFFSHDFHMYGETIGDTAYYLPSHDAVIHYKRRRYFIISGITEDKDGLFEYAVGSAETEGVDGTFKDSEDGKLNKNPIAQGRIDSTISFKVKVPGNSEKTIYYWISVGKEYEKAKGLHLLVKEYGIEKLLIETEFYWRSWVNKQGIDFADLPKKIIKLFKQSLLIMRTQIDNKGAIIAANDTDNLQFNKDTYSYMWPRDGAIVAYAMDKLGYMNLSDKFFMFCNRIVTKEGFFLHKYSPDGSLGSSWHPWIMDGKKQLPIQEDGTGLILWSLWNHYNQYRDIDFVRPLYESLIVRCADFLAGYRDKKTKLPKPSYDLWEERYGIFAYTCSAVYAGLTASSEFARVIGDESRRKKYSKAALEIRRAVERYLYDKNLGRFIRSINMIEGKMEKDTTIDSSLYALFFFGVFPVDDKRIERTMNSIKESLWVKTRIGGIARYENDHYHQVSKDISKIPGNPWFICTLWLAQWYIGKAEKENDLKEAKKILGWAVKNSQSSGILAEQIHPKTGKPLSVSPLTWSHAEFVIAVMNYLDKLRELVRKK